MHSIKLKLKNNSYSIIAGTNIIGGLGTHVQKLKLGRDAYIITNRFLKIHYGKILDQALEKAGFSVRFRLVADSEKSKSIDQAYAIIKDIARYDKEKSIFIVAFGGGVVGDLAGFIASVYKRGIPYIQVPTTLLAQVDSSIGGKTAVDLGQGKNLVGAIYQPRLVLSEVGFLDTLDDRQIRSGLAEVIKYAAIKDPKLFTYLEKNYKKVLARQKKALEFIVCRCAKIKAEIVELDEREERGIRTILNFGHTIGHAIEAAGGYKSYNHGEAIAQGMLVAADISKVIGGFDASAAKRLERLIKTVGLPLRIKKISLNAIIKAHYRDKKFKAQINKFVLLSNIGEVKIQTNIPLKVIKDALSKRVGD